MDPKISIFGHGKVAKCLMNFLNSRGIFVNVFSDEFSEPTTDGKNFFANFTDFRAQNSHLEIISPGIAPHHPVTKMAQNLISEFDFFAQILNAHKNIWISGTNGKTTTTEMIFWLFSRSGHHISAAGNIGTPLGELFCDEIFDFPQILSPDPKNRQKSAKKNEFLALEMSSFALHYTKNVAPKFYALLPVTPDHITWHGDFKAYEASKLSPLLRMKKNSIAILPKKYKNFCQILNFSGRTIFYENSWDLARVAGVNLSDFTKFSEPFLTDAMMACAVFWACMKKLPPKKILNDFAQNFSIGAHRMQEFFVDFSGSSALFVNDSKATNADATAHALKKFMKKNVLLIIGGEDKNADDTALFDAVLAHESEIFLFLIGKNARNLQKKCEKFKILHENSGTLDAAMRRIHEKIAPDPKKFVTILSPAAASTDQFCDYVARGERFMELARQKFE